jgi:ElaB/YqjD/DUF883 family membrane-anchored ribosome-binding protein
MTPGGERNLNLGGSDRGVIEAAKEKSQGLAATVRDAAQTVQEKAHDGASAVAEQATRTWESTRHIAENVGSEVAERAETLYTDLITFARRNPLGCMLGCFGAGFVLGMLWRPLR